MKKFLYFFLSVVIIVLISKLYQSSLPEYNPKRDYVDLENEIIYDDSGFKTSFKIDPFRRDSLLKGEDEIARTLTSSDHIDNYEKNRINTRAN